MRSVHKVSSQVIWKIETFLKKIQGPRNIVQGQKWYLSSLQSRHLGISHSFLSCHQLPHCIFLNLTDSLKSHPFQRWFLVLRKASRVPNMGYSGAESPGWFDVSPKNPAHDVTREWAYYPDAANHQLPIAVAFWIIQIVSMEECSSLMQNLMHIRCFTHSVILNVTST